MLDRYFLDLRGMSAQDKQDIEDTMNKWAFTTSVQLQEGEGMVGLSITWDRKDSFENFLKVTGLEGKVKYQKII